MSSNDNNEDIFQIAAKAHKLLQEILSTNKTNSKTEPLIKQEPVVPAANPTPVQPAPTQFNYTAQFPTNQFNGQFYQQDYSQQYLLPTQQNLIISPNFYMQHPPPILPNAPIVQQQQQQPFFYPQQPQRSNYYQSYNTFHPNLPPPNQTPVVQMQQQHHHHYYQQYNPLTPPPQPAALNQFYRKRKFGELNNFDNNNNINNMRFKATYQAKATTYTQPGEQTSEQSNTSGVNLNEEEDLNIMRERELKELKCKSVVEKMSVFLKYYQQFKEAYIQRVQSIECSDSLKIQFHSLIKYLNEYENLLAELNMMINEHERDQCKNNHRKTKKFFNKTKAFIRYECNKRLQANIFEYRRLINSQDRYAGMYDLLDMNSYLISLLPDIGVSIRRYINRCEKAREQEQLEEDEDYQQQWYSEENSNDSEDKKRLDPNDLTIPTFKEFVALNQEDLIEEEDELDEEDEEEDDDDEEDNGDEATKENKKKKRKLIEAQATHTHEKNRVYDSFSKGIDSLNRYLLKRVDEEESLDELVKERIIKWINKRQAKYILIFSEVDKLLNQHKAGECYSKFHSYLLFNLGKLVTVCDSYHQKLKELLYSTTIRRKKKRKKVKLLPESMADVFDEIIDLKRGLEITKINIKRCNLNSGKETAKQF